MKPGLGGMKMGFPGKGGCRPRPDGGREHGCKGERAGAVGASGRGWDVIVAPMLLITSRKTEFPES